MSKASLFLSCEGARSIEGIGLGGQGLGFGI